MITATIISLMYKFYKDNKIYIKKYKVLEQRLFGMDNDDTDIGFIKRTDERLETQKEDIDEIKSDMKDINNLVHRIDDKISNNDDNNYNIKSGDD